MRQSNKKGFTLVELMVVAIIVAILAAVAIPLMSGNKRRAVATEGQAGCSTIRTAVRVYYAENNAMPGAATGAALMTALPGLTAQDLDGTYFSDSSYAYAPAGTRGMTITATTDANKNPPATGTVILTVADDQSSTWSGTLIQ